MKGKHKIVVKNNRLHYEFEIKRNITIIKGDSATGKTTLINMIRQFANLGNASGIEIECDAPCTVLEGNMWQMLLKNLSGNIIFIDEENQFIRQQEFAELVKASDNYFVIITRENLYNLPYSVEEIYGLYSSGKYQNTKQIYQEMYHIYPLNQELSCKPDKIIVEDTNSGYEYFKAISKEKNIVCESAGGKTKIFAMLEQLKAETESICVIADGAAIGPEMDALYKMSVEKGNIKLYLPESFEWIILSSELLEDKEIKDIMDKPENYIESQEYFSWERFFTKLLVDKTAGTYLKYQKGKLNPTYLHEKNKNIIVFGIVMAISLSVALNIGNIFGGIGTFFKILNPIILGCMLAVIFNVPMEALSRQLEKLSKKVKFLRKEKARNGISLVVTIVIVVLVFAVIMWSIIPDLIESITGFIKNFDNNVNVVTDILDKYDEHLTFINDYVEKIDWNSILKKSGEVAGAFFQSIFTGIPQIGSSLFNLSISVIIAVYVLMDKRRLLSQTERLLEAVFGKKVSSKVTGVTNLFAQTYASFLTGQCVEACILAVLMFVTLSICRMPYAGLISIMAAVFQFVPYIGTFLACVVGAFLVLFTNPVLTIWFVIVFQVVQFIEGQFIYPRVVGSSVGLPALFTLMAVFLGGKFFGLLGMIFFIPLTSVIYQLLRDMVNNRLSSDKAGNDITPETGNTDTLQTDSGSAE